MNTTPSGLTTFSYNETVRTVLIRSHEEVSRSGLLALSVFGGSRGGTVSLSRGVSLSIQGFAINMNTGVSYPVPVGRTGNIAVEARIKVGRYRIQKQYRGNPRWYDAGEFTHRTLIFARYVPVYW